MQLRFEVGDRERHTVDYSWDQTWGRLTVAVDGDVVVRRWALFSTRLVKTVELTVGDTEKHQVRIEKRRPLVASFAQPQPVEAFVDGELVAEDPGKIEPTAWRAVGLILIAAGIAWCGVVLLVTDGDLSSRNWRGIGTGVALVLVGIGTLVRYFVRQRPGQQ